MTFRPIALILLPLLLSACGSSTPDAVAPASAAQAAPEDHAAEGGSTIALTPAQLDAAGIELAIAGPARIRETLPLYGVVAPNAERVREVAARYPGMIRSVNGKMGDAVKLGEVLATIESNESLQTYSVTAPLSGVISARNANPGEQAADKALFTVADLSTVWIELSLFPRDVARVRAGQSVVVKNADAGLAAEGKVVYVAPFGSSANQTLTARVLLDNPERSWAPGLYVTAEVTLAETSVPLTIRNTAVQLVHDVPVVFVRGDQGFEARPVQIGRNDGEISEVLGGLHAGETYTAANSYVLKAEALKSEAEEE